MPIKQAYGTWNSPLSPQSLADSLRLNDVMWDTDGETLVWSERRATGTVLVMQKGTSASRDLTDSTYTIGGRVGYGGGEFTVHGGIVYFVSKGRLYCLPLKGGTAKALTPQFGGAAAPSVSPDNRWLTFLHSYEDNDVLAIVDTEGKQWAQKLTQGNDFYMHAVWHPNSQQLAYITWNHPNMPWNGTELYLATLQQEGDNLPVISSQEHIAGDLTTSIFQPEFSPDGRTLAYISDATGYGQLYLYDLATKAHRQITTAQAEHATPAWVHGLRMYGWSADSSAIYYLRHYKGFYSLWVYDLEHSSHLQIQELAPYTAFDRISVSPTSEKFAVLASSSAIPTRILSYSQQEGVRIVRRSSSESLSRESLSMAQAFTWQGHDDEEVHGLYYEPKNPDYEGLGKPPLLIRIHGGPTSHVGAAYNTEAQLFTTRGFAVLYVNHRGSTGHGKAYMNKHKGAWGVYDVQDSITGAKYLIQQGLADADKIIIMGGSAGGYTVLQALVDAPKFFKAGICSYGIANQFTLVLDTHKFEARYSDWLLGALPEAAAVYRDRSPLFKAKQIQDALIVFQGADDVVVPKNQSDAIVNAIKGNNIPHDYIVYEGEGHGFSKPETIADFYTRSLKFLLENVIYS